MNVVTLEKAVKDFSVTRIYPLKPDTFSDTDFLPSSVTDIPKEYLGKQTNNENNLEPIPGSSSCEIDTIDPMPGPSINSA